MITRIAVRTRIALDAAPERFRRVRGDRGDVPGWVLVAVMTAGLVTALWFVADGQFTSIFNRAITSVSKP
jgi:hypothetical protein